ncbi:MAG TPA: ubiquinol-cytochrome C chaperone family protein [Acetobacteraceae bacterium]|nr:ubiquinol-cytochrome C chaperone family protein [Acetobacteraceae bacterium]
MLGRLRRPRHDRAAAALYAAAVAAARAPEFYEALGVPDTLDGRFDLVGLHAFLLIRRLARAEPPGPELSQAVFDTMFRDMDANLREIGVGDLSVKKKMKQMWEAFHGRAAAYEAALVAEDAAALQAALARNVWRGAPAPQAAALAHVVRAQAAHLGTQPFAVFLSGEARFLPFAEALR